MINGTHQGVTGDHWLLEAALLDAAEEKLVLGRALRVQHADAAQLRHRLHLQHACRIVNATAVNHMWMGMGEADRRGGSPWGRGAHAAVLASSLPAVQAVRRLC